MRGMERQASTMRIITVSSGPPTKPEIAPYIVPTVVAVSMASTAMASDTRPPKRTRLRTLRLAGSVPNGWASEGAWFLSATISRIALGG